MKTRIVRLWRRLFFLLFGDFIREIVALSAEQDRAYLDWVESGVREYLKIKFEHTESELDAHDSRMLSAIAQSTAELVGQVRNIQADFELLKRDIAEREIQNRAELAAWLTPKFTAVCERVENNGEALGTDHKALGACLDHLSARTSTFDARIAQIMSMLFGKTPEFWAAPLPREPKEFNFGDRQ